MAKDGNVGSRRTAVVGLGPKRGRPSPLSQVSRGDHLGVAVENDAMWSVPSASRDLGCSYCGTRAKAGGR